MRSNGWCPLTGKEGVEQQNDVADIALASSGDPHGRTNLWRAEDIEDVLANLDADSRMSAHLVLMHWTGLRPSQTGRLRRDDFRLDESDPYVLTLQEKGALQAAMAAIPLVGDGFAARRRNVRDERVAVGGRIPDFPVARSHPPASWPSAANSSICRTYRKTAGEESRRRSPVANRWMHP